jgi:FAD dependent oxidoreductase
MKTIVETQRDTPVSDAYDVLICGGGPAGVAAALAAARTGARTGLIEGMGCLGGIWTSSYVSWLLDHHNKTGIMAEIKEQLARRNARTIANGVETNAFDVEKMKLILDEMCLEAGVDIHFHTHVADAIVEDGRLTHALIESKSGRQAVAAKVFIDCTGDGDVAARAGCGYDMGNPETGKTQPMSLLAILGGLDPAAIKPFFRYAGEVTWPAPKDLLRAEMEKAGVSPSYGKPTLFWLSQDMFLLMANHQYGVRSTEATDITRATLEARREVHALADGLHSLGGVWGNLQLISTAAHIGMREGRRIHGLYTVRDEDVRDSARHEDAVCRVTFALDVHSTSKSKTSGIEPKPFQSQAYDIPLRALIAKDVEGLMMAGRCISGDFLAHSCYRITGNAVAMGEAAGRVAARAAEAGRSIRDISWGATTAEAGA